MADSQTQSTALNLDGEICQDAAALRDKQRVLKQQWTASAFASVNQIMTFMAGIFMAGASGTLLPIMSKEGVAGIMSTALGNMGLGLLVAAAVSTVVAVGVNMMSQHYGSSAYFDQSETNAQHNAKYIVMELKKEAARAAKFEHEQNCRADGKSWAQVVRPGQQQEPQLAPDQLRA